MKANRAHTIAVFFKVIFIFGLTKRRFREDFLFSPGLANPSLALLLLIQTAGPILVASWLHSAHLELIRGQGV